MGQIRKAEAVSEYLELDDGGSGHRMIACSEGWMNERGMSIQWEEEKGLGWCRTESHRGGR